MSRDRSFFCTVVERDKPHPVSELWARAREKAAADGRLPLALVESTEYGTLIVVNEREFDVLAHERGFVLAPLP